MIRMYNTLTRAKEAFEPLEAGKVKMYVCGPTVYDYIHIGNARPVIFFDVVRRYLETAGYEVTYIVNFTDVDDKLIRKAEQLGTTVPEVADRFIAAFNDDIEALGVRQRKKPPFVQHMRDAMGPYGVQAGISEHNLEPAPRRRVILENSLYIGAYVTKHRQPPLSLSAQKIKPLQPKLQRRVYRGPTLPGRRKPPSHSCVDNGHDPLPPTPCDGRGA